MQRDWVKTVGDSISHYSALHKMFVDALTNTALSEEQRHTCAMAAALAGGNGELVYEISMCSVLFGKPVRETVVECVAVANTVATVNHWGTSVGPSSSTSALQAVQSPHHTETHAMISLCAAVVYSDIPSTIKLTRELQDNWDWSGGKIAALVSLVGVVTSINKIVF